MIKDQKVPVTVTTVSNGYLVKGKLPDTVKGSYIRVEIFANGPNQCDRADGWLLKVAK
jgi:carotenoid cleavage dioxygenase-like enzyme